MNELMSLCRLLRDERERRGMTGKEVGALWGISQPSYSRLESGESEFSLERIVQAARFIGISIDLAVTLSQTADPEPLHNVIATVNARIDLVEERLRKLEGVSPQRPELA